MAFKKFSADKLFDGNRFLDEGSVLVTNEEGLIENIVPLPDAGDDIRRLNGILCPGFINCHGHLELAHMKGRIPENTGLEDFVVSVVQQRSEGYTEEQIADAMEKAENEMLAAGIVAAGDICNNAGSLRQKLKGKMFYHNFIEASAFDPAKVDERFERALQLFRAYAQFYSLPVESNSIVPHAPYSVADKLWEKILNFPGNHLFTIHNQESRYENEWFLNKKGAFTRLYEKMQLDTGYFNPTGKSSLQSFLPRFLRNQSLILVHNVHTSAEDILFSQGSVIADNIFWCFCPNANWYITQTLPDFRLFIKNNCRIVLGTDSLASNHQLDILSEINTIRRHFPDIQVETLLQWATRNGARALELDPVLGSFDAGKKPGVLQISESLSKVERLL
jgi:aminodeoxyfutalosine deaminase